MKKSLAQFLDGLSIAIVAAGVVLIGYGLISSSLRASGSSSEDRLDEALVRLVGNGQRIGSTDASTVIVFFSDYSCGFCQELHPMLTTLLARYPEHLAVVVKHFLDPSSIALRAVAQGAECAAEQDKFVAYHAAAYSARRVLRYTTGWLQLADSVGVANRDAFEECVRSRKHLGRVASHYQEGRSFGVTATPTMNINGEWIIGAPSMETLDSLIVHHFPGRSR